MEKVGNVLIDLMEDLSRVSTNGEAFVKINKSLCSPEQFKTLFNYFARGTILERIELEVGQLEAHVDCSCGYSSSFEGEHSGYTRCPRCGKFAEVEDEAYKLEKPDPSVSSSRISRRF